MSDQLKKPGVPLGQHRMGRYLCEEIAMGRECEHHEKIAARLYEIVQRAQVQEREEEAQKALDRIVEDVVKRGTHAV